MTLKACVEFERDVAHIGVWSGSVGHTVYVFRGRRLIVVICGVGHLNMGKC